MQTCNTYKWIVVAAVVLTLGVAYYFIDPALHKWVPKCPFMLLTGWKCPGCGSQRVLHALTHGQIVEAFRQNALFIPAMLYVLAIIVSRRSPAIHNKITGKVAGWILFTVIIVFWITRNIFGF